MQKVISILLIVCYVTAIFPSIPVYAAEKSWIAVIPFEARGISKESAGLFFDSFHREIINSKRFNVVERERIDKLLQELALQQTGCTDSECVIQIGRMANADKVMAGSITRIGDKIVAEARVINLETAKIDFAESAECKCKEDEINQLAEDLAIKILRQLPLTGKVISVDEDGVYIDLGKNDGLMKDTELKVERLGKEIIDDDTGDVIMRRKEDVGKIKIETLDNAGSFAEIVEEEKDIRKGDIVSVKLTDVAYLKEKDLILTERKSSKKWLWIGLGVLAIGGAGAAVAMSGSDDGGEEDAGTGSVEIIWGW